jgi:preprotein translocase subunit YajC
VGFLIFLLIAFALMWFLVAAPQRRQRAAHKAMLANLKAGDEVLTAGGLYGDVTEIGEDEIAMEIAPNVEVRVAMRAIAAVIPPDTYEAEEEEPAETEPVPELEAAEASTEGDRR